MPKIKIVEYSNGMYAAKRRILGMFWLTMCRKTSEEYLFDDPVYLERLVERYISEKKEEKEKRKKPKEVYTWKNYVY